MKRSPCKVCGSEDGPAIYASDDTCSVSCQKVLSGEWTVEYWEEFTGKKARHEV